jgi:hypothetical protein
MKNIHILPTGKKSRLFLDYYNNLFIVTTKDFITKINKFQNLYITSDEEIKEGDWVLNIEENTIFKPSNDEIYDIKNSESKYYEYCKKIILTTGQDLIKDGVQAIDDEFLKWFVKNPSCESVKVDSYKTIYHNWIYKIIIPKEEPKPIHEQIIDLCGGEEQFKEIAGLKPKQETIEEACERIYQEDFNNPYSEEVGRIDIKSAMIKLAKWQQEQDKNKYSEEEVIELLNKREDYINQTSSIFDYITAKEWFEQFKKK